MLLACLTCVIWFSHALRIAAEVFSALIASYSVFAHAFSGLPSYLLPAIVLLIQISYSSDYLHYISTTTFCQILIFSHKLHLNNLFNFFIIIFANMFFDFILMYWKITVLFRTSYLFLSSFYRLHSMVLKTDLMY